MVVVLSLLSGAGELGKRNQQPVSRSARCRRPGATCPSQERNPWDPVVWVNPAQPPSVETYFGLTVTLVSEFTVTVSLFFGSGTHKHDSQLIKCSVTTRDGTYALVGLGHSNDGLHKLQGGITRSSG